MSIKQNRAMSYRRPWFWICISGVLALAGLSYWFFFVNPLPSDEEMIEHFRAHRNEIQALVDSYRREGMDGGGRAWTIKPDIRRLMQQSGVGHVIYVRPIWFPNPYAADGSGARANRETVARTRSLRSNQVYGTISVEFNDPRYFRRTFRYLHGAIIFKHLVHFPIEPRIENNLLQLPFNAEGEQDVRRVLSSLNWYPDDWKLFECVYRRIESQWFIHMCRSS